MPELLTLVSDILPVMPDVLQNSEVPVRYAKAGTRVNFTMQVSP